MLPIQGLTRSGGPRNPFCLWDIFFIESGMNSGSNYIIGLNVLIERDCLVWDSAVILDAVLLWGYRNKVGMTLDQAILG